MRRILALLAVATLSGCGVWSTTMRSDILDYSNVIEQSNDRFLLINILEARDDAPLHFVALPNIHGSLQATASVAGTVPYRQGIERDGGEAADTFLNGSINPTFSVQSAPSFEVDSIETKDFATGIASPIAPKFVKYWVDRGLDKRLIVLLFFSSAQITETIAEPKGGTKQTRTIVVLNDPRSAADQLDRCKRDAQSAGKCHRRTQFEHYLTLSDSIGSGIAANSYTERTPLGKAFELHLTRDLKKVAALDPTKYKLVYQSNGKYMLYSVSSDENVVLCFNHTLALPAPSSPTTQPASEDDVCTASIVSKKPEAPPNAVDTLLPPSEDLTTSGDCTADTAMSVQPSTHGNYCAVFRAFICYASAAAGLYKDKNCPQSLLDANRTNPWKKDQFSIQFNIRSTGEIIRFLGDLVYFQELMGRPDLDHNIPITLGWYYDLHHDANGNRIMGRSDCPLEDGGCLFQLHAGTSGGRIDVVYHGHSYSVAEHEPTDHTLEVLAIVNGLVNLNRSASDLRTTPTVQIVP